MNRTWFFFILSLILLSACKTKDTCNEVLGPTFQDISIKAVNEENSGVLSVEFNWDALEVLPDAYFASASLLRADTDRFNNPWINDHEKLDSWTASAEGILFVIKAEATPMIDSTLAYYHLHYRFPDRRDFIDCEHSGSSDAYYFDINFGLERQNDSILLQELVWQETFRKGGF